MQRLRTAAILLAALSSLALAQAVRDNKLTAGQ